MRVSRNMSLLQGSNIAALLVTVLVNALSEILPLNGKNTAQISDTYANLFTPAGYVFSVWSVIYALLFVFAVYQASSKRREKDFLGRIGLLFVLSCVANCAWIFLWHYEQIALSVIVMFILLASLILIYLRLGIGLRTPTSEEMRRERLYVHLPFSVYLGWITVAPIANVAAALVAARWNGFGVSEAAWTALLLVVALLVTMLVILTRRDLAFSLVILWALGGIIVKQIQNQIIVLTSGVSMAVIVVALLYAHTRRLRAKKE